MVFLTAWEKGERVRFVDGSLLPWLLVVSTNLVRHYHRARRRYDARLASIAGQECVPDIADRVADDVDGARDVARLSVALARLRAVEQDVISLCDLGGLTYEDAACALGIPVGTVRSRLSRARARLSNLMHDDSAVAPTRPTPTGECR